MLDDLDKELERRGHAFCRYADDCNIYVHSRKAGERVMESVTTFLEKKLKLRVNREKSAVDEVWRRTFLGYRLGKGGKLHIAPESLSRFSSVMQNTLWSPRERATEKLTTKEVNFSWELAQPRVR